MILISVAHSRKAKGASNQAVGINEYDISCNASWACMQLLVKNGYPCTLLDCAEMDARAYSAFKVNTANTLNPNLSIEIHCNSCPDPKVKYGCVVYSDQSERGGLVASNIAQSLYDGFSKSINKLDYSNKGAVKRSLITEHSSLFFVDKVKNTSIIVEGLFISNPTHATWLKNGGDSAYGTLVADGIIKYLTKELR